MKVEDAVFDTIEHFIDTNVNLHDLFEEEVRELEEYDVDFTMGLYTFEDDKIILTFDYQAKKDEDPS